MKRQFFWSATAALLATSALAAGCRTASPPAGHPPTAAARVARSEELRGNPRFTLPRATVSTDGTVSDVKIVRSLDRELDRAAMEAARAWRFTPATLDGVPIPVIVTIELTFYMR